MAEKTKERERERWEGRIWRINICGTCMGGHKITGEEKITEQNREKNIQEKEGIEKKNKKKKRLTHESGKIYIYI